MKTLKESILDEFGSNRYPDGKRCLDIGEYTSNVDVSHFIKEREEDDDGELESVSVYWKNEDKDEIVKECFESFKESIKESSDVIEKFSADEIDAITLADFEENIDAENICSKAAFAYETYCNDAICNGDYDEDEDE